MKRKKGDSAAHPSIFHPEIYVPNSKLAEQSKKDSNPRVARPQSRLLKPPPKEKPTDGKDK